VYQGGTTVIPQARFGGSFETELGRSACYSGSWLVVLIVNGHGFQVFRLKHLVAIQASDVIDPIAPRQDFGSGMLAIHKGEDYSLF